MSKNGIHFFQNFVADAEYLIFRDEISNQAEIIVKDILEKV